MSGPERSPAAWVNEIVSGARYHPFALGARSAAATAVGAVASYLSVAEAGVLTFPARSVHVPDTCRVAPSGPLKVGVVHTSTPEVASVPVTFSVTGCRYQPFLSGPRANTPDAAGAVASNLNVSAAGALGFPALSVHVPERETFPESGPE